MPAQQYTKDGGRSIDARLLTEVSSLPSIQSASILAILLMIAVAVLASWNPATRAIRYENSKTPHSAISYIFLKRAVTLSARRSGNQRRR